MKRQLLSEFGIFSYMFNTFPLNNRPRKVTLPKILIREGLFLLEGSLMTTITITTAAMSATFPSGDTKLLPSISLRFLHFSFLLITSSASSSFFSLLLLFVLNLLLLLLRFFFKVSFFHVFPQLHNFPSSCPSTSTLCCGSYNVAPNTFHQEEICGLLALHHTGDAGV